jgi:hypothetical protein
MITPDALRQRVLEELDSANLLPCLELEASVFCELPPLFEVSHLSMRLTLNDVAAVAMTSSIAAKLKRDLQQHGIELEYSIAAQWKVLAFYPDTLQRCRRGGWMPAENFQVQVESGTARRSVGIRVSPDGEERIRQYLSQIPMPDQERVLYQLLEACLNQQLATSGIARWDPVLHPNRTIGAQDVAKITHSWKDEAKALATSNK